MRERKRDRKNASNRFRASRYPANGLPDLGCRPRARDRQPLAISLPLGRGRHCGDQARLPATRKGVARLPAARRGDREAGAEGHAGETGGRYLNTFVSHSGLWALVIGGTSEPVSAKKSQKIVWGGGGVGMPVSDASQWRLWPMVKESIILGFGPPQVPVTTAVSYNFFLRSLHKAAHKKHENQHQ